MSTAQKKDCEFSNEARLAARYASSTGIAGRQVLAWSGTKEEVNRSDVEALQVCSAKTVSVLHEPQPSGFQPSASPDAVIVPGGMGRDRGGRMSEGGHGRNG